MPADRFEWNMPGLVELSNDALEAWCVPIAEQVEQAAQEAAPVGETGDYKASIHIEKDLRTGPDDFAHVRVVADDDKAAIIEARRGVLGRALSSATE